MNTVLIALLMPLIVELVKERSPVLALRAIRLAVRPLPRAHRDRYREEWIAELDEMERQNISNSSPRCEFCSVPRPWVGSCTSRIVSSSLTAATTETGSWDSP